MASQRPSHVRHRMLECDECHERLYRVYVGEHRGEWACAYVSKHDDGQTHYFRVKMVRSVVSMSRS